jgi:pyruvate dehydrogenase E1 component
MKMVPHQLSPWLGDRLLSLGTDGFGRSDNREFLRRHFEVDANSIAAAALSRLVREGKFEPVRAQSAFQELNIDSEAIDPAVA